MSVVIYHNPDCGTSRNVLAILRPLVSGILLRYREGDANVRAVWLFSRNDAIGNAAVVAAALAVAATGSPWPDLLTAAAIAGLFIHSAVKIVGDALGELKTTR